jgi:hypothetical protein
MFLRCNCKLATKVFWVKLNRGFGREIWRTGQCQNLAVGIVGAFPDAAACRHPTEFIGIETSCSCGQRFVYFRPERAPEIGDLISKFRKHTMTWCQGAK